MKKKRKCEPETEDTRADWTQSKKSLTRRNTRGQLIAGSTNSLSQWIASCLALVEEQTPAGMRRRRVATRDVWCEINRRWSVHAYPPIAAVANATRKTDRWPDADGRARVGCLFMPRVDGAQDERKNLGYYLLGGAPYLFAHIGSD
uniref:Uncharacterized protein n=1 Tax=Plectus sambesii TaxID=2011161 RepID=A0A914WKF2_9BILA